MTADGVIYRFVVPANTQATLRLPAKDLTSIQLDGKSLPKALARQASFSNGQVEMPLVAGRYAFKVKK